MPKTSQPNRKEGGGEYRPMGGNTALEETKTNTLWGFVGGNNKRLASPGKRRSLECRVCGPEVWGWVLRCLFVKGGPK